MSYKMRETFKICHVHHGHWKITYFETEDPSGAIKGNLVFSKKTGFFYVRNESPPDDIVKMCIDGMIVGNHIESMSNKQPKLKPWLVEQTINGNIFLIPAAVLLVYLFLIRGF